MRKYLLLLFLLFIPCRAHGQTNIQRGPNNPTFCTPGAFFYNTTLTAYQQCGPANTWGATGGITSVSSIPATCTPGVTAPVTLSVPPYGIYICTATNTWTIDSALGGAIIPASFGVKALWQAESTGTNFTVTSGSAIVTCTTCKFQTSTYHPAAIGDDLFATNWNGNDTTYVTAAAVIGFGSGVPITITSVDSDTQVHISANASGNAGTTNANAGVLAWGPDDNAAWALVKAAAYDGLTCLPVQAPQGLTNVNGAQFLSAACRGISGGTTASKYPSITGWGTGGNVTFVLPPWFQTTGCTAGGDSKACFGPVGSWSYVTFNGFGQGTFADGSKSLFETGNDNTYLSLSFWGFAGTGTNSGGFVIQGGYHEIRNITVDGFGKNTCVVSGAAYNDVFSIFCGNSALVPLTIQNAATLKVVGMTSFMSTTSGAGVQILGNGVYDEKNGLFFSPTNASTCWLAQNTSIVSIDNSICVNNTNAGSAAIQVQNTATFKYRNSQLQGGGTGPAIQCGATASCLDQGGNFGFGGNPVGNAPTCTVTGAGATATCAVEALSTPERGTILITAAGAAPAALGTIVLAFNQAFTVAGSSPACSWTLDNTGNTAWNARATLIVNARSTTAETVNWDNNAAALVATNTVKAGYTCTAR